MTKRTFGFEVLIWILLKNLNAAFSTEIITPALIDANQSSGISSADLQAAHRVQRHLLSSICHIWFLNPTKLKASLFLRATPDTAKYLRIPLLTVLDQKYTNPAGQDDQIRDLSPSLSPEALFDVFPLPDCHEELPFPSSFGSFVS